jgi:hypothetical protein
MKKNFLQNWSNPFSYMLQNPELIAMGFATLIFISFCLIIAIRMIYKGIKLKYYTISNIGVVFIGGATLWSGVALNFLTTLFLNTLPPWELHFLFHGGFIGIAIFFWIRGITSLAQIEKNTRRDIMIISGFVLTVLEILYIAILFTDYTLLGKPIEPIQVVYQPFSWIYLSISLGIFLISAAWFVIQTFRSEESKVQLQGKFLLFAGIFFLIGSILEIFFSEIFILLTARFFITMAVLLGYIGFLMPERVKKIFLK